MFVTFTTNTQLIIISVMNKQIWPTAIQTYSSLQFLINSVKFTPLSTSSKLGTSKGAGTETHTIKAYCVTASKEESDLSKPSWLNE